MIRTSKVLGSILVLSVLGSSAAAQGQQLLLGGSLGYSRLEIDAGGGADVEGGDVAFKVHGRYMFTEAVGVELGYTDFGAPDDTVMGFDAEADTTGIVAYVVGSFPAGEAVDLFAKGGLVRWDTDLSVGPLSGSDDGTDIALGFGATFAVGGNVNLRTELEWFDIEDTDLFGVVSFGVEVAVL